MNSNIELFGEGKNKTPFETESTVQPDKNQSALYSLDLNINKQNSAVNSEFNNIIPEGVIMDDENIQQPEENQDASQNPNADQNSQDSSDSTQSNESASVRRSQQPTNREVAKAKNAIDKKGQKVSGLKNALATTKSILDRGYYKEEMDAVANGVEGTATNGKKGTVRIVYLSDSDIQFEQHKLAQLKVELKAESDALNEMKKHFKTLTTRSIDGSKFTLAVITEQSRNRNVSDNAVNALKKVVTKETVSDFPSLASLAQGKQENLIVLESFFSTNLTSAYSRFKDNPELKDRIFGRSTTYIKNLVK